MKHAANVRACNSGRTVSNDPWVLRLKRSCRPCTARMSLISTLFSHSSRCPYHLNSALWLQLSPNLPSSPGAPDPGRQPGWRALCQWHQSDNGALVSILACDATTKAALFHALPPNAAAAAAAPCTVTFQAGLLLCYSWPHTSSMQRGVGVPAWQVQQCRSPGQLEASRACVNGERVYRMFAGPLCRIGLDSGGCGSSQLQAPRSATTQCSCGSRGELRTRLTYACPPRPRKTEEQKFMPQHDAQL